MLKAPEQKQDMSRIRIEMMAENAMHFGMTEVMIGFDQAGKMTSIHFCSNEKDVDTVAEVLDVHILTADAEKRKKFSV